MGSVLHSYFHWIAVQRSRVVWKDPSELKPLLLLSVLAASFYGLLIVDGMILMQQGVASSPEALTVWTQLRQLLTLSRA
jgi:uncharacterized membrane protein